MSHLREDYCARFVISAFLALLTSSALGQGHSYINYTRSSVNKNVYVSQSLEGIYGKIVKHGIKKTEESVAPEASDLPNERTPDIDLVSSWRGYGLKSSIGVEWNKFLRFGVSHTLVNLRAVDNRLENLQGSRLSADWRLAFLAPVVNLNVGGGLLGSKMDYLNQLDSADYVGSGYYVSLGFDRFVTYSLSIFGEIAIENQRLVKSQGVSSHGDMTTDVRSLNLGFSLWL